MKQLITFKVLQKGKHLTPKKKLMKTGPWIKSPFNGVKGVTPYLQSQIIRKINLLGPGRGEGLKLQYRINDKRRTQSYTPFSHQNWI